MLGDPRSHGLWERSAPPPPAMPPLVGDVAVIGVGFTSLSAALPLAKAAPVSSCSRRRRSASAAPGTIAAW